VVGHSHTGDSVHGHLSSDRWLASQTGDTVHGYLGGWPARPRRLRDTCRCDVRHNLRIVSESERPGQCLELEEMVAVWAQRELKKTKNVGAPCNVTGETGL
jgi:hypothetical protein